MYKEYLSYNEVLDKIDQYQVMCEILGYQDIGKRFCNPLRSDKHPGAWLEWYGNRLVLCDFPWEHNSSDCVKLWSLAYSVSINQALEEIYSKNYKRSVKIKPQIKEFKTHIKPKERNWSDRDRDYWEGKYDFTKYQLLEIGSYTGKFFPVQEYELNTRFGLITIQPTDICYAWKFKSGNYKLYKPHGDVLNKWISNVDSNDLFFESDFRFKTCLLGSSWKDCAILYRELNCSFRAFQNEKVITNWDWVKNFDKIIISLDNDKTGIEMSHQYKSILNNLSKESIIYNTPSCKDWADLYEKDKRVFKEAIKPLLL